MRKLDFTDEHEEKLFKMLKELFPSDFPYPRRALYLAYCREIED